MELLIQPGKLTLADLRQAYLNPIKVKLMKVLHLQLMQVWLALRKL